MLRPTLFAVLMASSCLLQSHYYYSLQIFIIFYSLNPNCKEKYSGILEVLHAPAITTAFRQVVLFFPLPNVFLQVQSLFCYSEKSGNINLLKKQREK